MSSRRGFLKCAAALLGGAVTGVNADEVKPSVDDTPPKPKRVHHVIQPVITKARSGEGLLFAYAKYHWDHIVKNDISYGNTSITDHVVGITDDSVLVEYTYYEHETEYVIDPVTFVGVERKRNPLYYAPMKYSLMANIVVDQTSNKVLKYRYDVLHNVSYEDVVTKHNLV